MNCQMNYVRRALTLLTLSHFMYGNNKYDRLSDLYDWHYAILARHH